MKWALHFSTTVCSCNKEKTNKGTSAHPYLDYTLYLSHIRKKLQIRDPDTRGEVPYLTLNQKLRIRDFWKLLYFTNKKLWKSPLFDPFLEKRRSLFGVSFVSENVHFLRQFSYKSPNKWFHRNLICSTYECNAYRNFRYENYPNIQSIDWKIFLIEIKNKSIVQ